MLLTTYINEIVVVNSGTTYMISATLNRKPHPNGDERYWTLAVVPDDGEKYDKVPYSTVVEGGAEGARAEAYLWITNREERIEQRRPVVL